MRIAVQHPEVDETLYVDECVLRVACPLCKVKAGVPCKGARFEWMARGERRGFRYIQGTHRYRRELFGVWKQHGRPRTLPPSVYETYRRSCGAFPKRVDKTSNFEVEPPVLKVPRKKKQAAKKIDRYEFPETQVRWYRGTKWETYTGNLWTWFPYTEFKDYTSISIFTGLPPFNATHLRFDGHEHECATLEDAFELAIELVVERAFLDVLNERARWRIRELERRYGADLHEPIVVARTP